MADVIDGYVRDVVAGDILAGSLQVAACARHVADCERIGSAGFPWVWDADRAQRPVRFFGELRHYKGEWAGQPIVLEPWQQFVVGSIFGWVHAETGLRRYRKSYVEIPRKNGKSLLAAGVILYLTFFDGEPGAEGYCAATKRDQAKIVFGDAKRLVQTSGLKARIAVQVANLHREASASKLEPLSADYDSMDGLNVHACILDEYHAQKDRGIVDVIETAMGARRQPHLLAITTAGADPLSPCGVERDYAASVVSGSVADETFFAFVAHADLDDDPFAKRTWQKANPNFAVSVHPEDLEALATKAKHMPSALSSFQQKRLDIWTTSETPWLNIDRWQAGQTEWTADDMVAQPCCLGVDLASKLDLCAVVAAFPPTDDRPTWRLLPWFLTPSDGLDERSRRDRVPYRQWIREGYLGVCDGSRIDQSDVERCILEAVHRFDVAFIGVDPWNAGNLITDLELAVGDDRVVEIPQNMTQLTEPSKEFEAEVGAGRMDAGGHPVMSWNARNVVVMRDSNDNIRPTKDPKKSRGRIDGIVAAIMAMKLARVDGPDECYTATRGLVSIEL